MSVAYMQEGLTLAPNWNNDPDLVLALQRDLRALGYLAGGLDGRYGPGTTRAVQALQYDLLHADASARATDGPETVTIASFNSIATVVGMSRVTQVTGIVDHATAACISRLLNDARVPKIPDAADPKDQNERALAAIGRQISEIAPTPFVRAIVMQESGGQHYHVPSGDDDKFLTVGLDHGDPMIPWRITSRGYGIGQHTLFHHPPHPHEVETLIADPVRNVQHTFGILRDKFDHFVVGPTSRADDRTAEHPLLPLRTCRYAPGDARYLRDCRRCAESARKIRLSAGVPVYPSATLQLRPDANYKSADYAGVPDRADFQCDWPYAVRRYNGAGNDSYHYQARVLLDLLRPLAP